MAKKQVVPVKSENIESTEQTQTGVQETEIKEKTIAEDTTPVEDTVATPEQKESIISVEDTTATLGKEKNTIPETTANESQFIPEYADSLLKLYDTHERLFIDSKGGVYVHSHDGAIEYANPYFIQ